MTCRSAKVLNLSNLEENYVPIKALYIENHMPPIRAPFEETLNIIFESHLYRNVLAK